MTDEHKMCFLQLTQLHGETLMAFYLFAAQFPTHLTSSAFMKVRMIALKHHKIY